MNRPVSPAALTESRVVRAGFSPVKGTRHLSLPSIDLADTGVIGDRRFCFVDLATQRVLRTVHHPTLVGLEAREYDGVLTLTAPDGRAVTATPIATGEQTVCDYWGRPTSLMILEGPHADLVSTLLGREATLTAAPPAAVIYDAPISVITQSSLDQLAQRVGHQVDPARFRATIVVDSPDPPGTEDTWAGREISLGSAVIRIGAPIGRCAVIDIDPATAQRDTGLLRALASYRPHSRAGEPTFGVYADVVVPGRVTVPEFSSSSGAA